MKRLSGLMFGVVALLVVGSPAAQTTYPDRPIRMVVGFPPGGAPDSVARLLGQKLAEALGKPLVMDNATGAGGNIATERVAKAAPDGYTLGFLVNEFAALIKSEIPTWAKLIKEWGIKPD